MDKIILAVASSYDRKYYFNKDFDALPDQVKEDIQITLVEFTMEIGGIITLLYEEDGTLVIETEADEEDILYDEIGSHLKIKQIRQQKLELLENLETFFKVFYLGEE